MNLVIEYLRNGAILARIGFKGTVRDAMCAAESGILEYRAKAARIVDAGGELLALVEKPAN